eukprot:comp22377_c0_seq1/m.54222 comp22377_c0_seq1/g.54222  ORF comp22377_c0_seq1/g.54222 comp22377_c0_seq1/m.54222 type:complete len:365 (+) comp22377_c0_seq1:1624-2718(+)
MHNRAIKEPKELRQRGLVHGAHERHFCDHKVDHRAAGCDGAVLLTHGVDLLLGLECRGDLFKHFLRNHLCVGEHADQLVVIDHVAFGVAQALKQCIFELLDALLVRVDLVQQRLALLFETGLLVMEHASEKLGLETGNCDGEVNHRGARTDLGLEVRVRQLGGQIQIKVRMVVDLLVTNLDAELAPNLDQLLVKHIVEHRVDLVLNVLNQQRLAVAHCVLEMGLELLVVERSHNKPLLGLLALDNPCLALALRVNQQRELARLCDKNTVLDRKIVGWQSFQVPAPDGGIVDKELRDTELAGVWDLALQEQLAPVVHKHTAEVLVEGASIADHSDTDRRVTDKTLGEIRKLGRLLGPALLFRGKP